MASQKVFNATILSKVASTASTRMTLSYPNTSGTLRTTTPIFQASGQLSGVQDLTGEPITLQFVSDGKTLHSIR